MPKESPSEGLDSGRNSFMLLGFVKDEESWWRNVSRTCGRENMICLAAQTFIRLLSHARSLS